MATKKEQIVECMAAMQNGMIQTANQDIWQSKLIWWICKSIYLLLDDKIKRKE